MKDIKPSEWAEQARYQLHYHLSQCGFGFLAVEIEDVDDELFILVVSDDLVPSIKIPLSIEQLTENGLGLSSLFGELALRILTHRENLLQDQEKRKYLMMKGLDYERFCSRVGQ